MFSSGRASKGGKLRDSLLGQAHTLGRGPSGCPLVMGDKRISLSLMSRANNESKSELLCMPNDRTS